MLWYTGYNALYHTQNTAQTNTLKHTYRAYEFFHETGVCVCSCNEGYYSILIVRWQCSCFRSMNNWCSHFNMIRFPCKNLKAYLRLQSVCKISLSNRTWDYTLIHSELTLVSHFHLFPSFLFFFNIASHLTLHYRPLAIDGLPIKYRWSHFTCIFPCHIALGLLTRGIFNMLFYVKLIMKQ